MIVIILVIAAALTLFKPYKIDFLFSFLDTLGNVVPPLPGILIADYFIVKSKYSPAWKLMSSASGIRLRS